MRFIKNISLWLLLATLSFSTPVFSQAIFHEIIAQPNPNAYNNEYQDILDRGTTLGYSLPSSGQQTLQDAFVSQLIADGIWAKLDILYVFATDGDGNFALINWITPASFQCSLVNAPTFTANAGYTGNGTTSYLDTNWIPSTNGVNYTLNSASFGGKINSGSASTTTVEFGASTASNVSGAYLFGRLSGSATYRANMGFSRAAATASPVGFWHGDRDLLASTHLYKDGAVFITATDNSVNSPDVSMTVGCMNNGGTKQNFSARQVSMFFAGGSLNSTEATALYNAWNTYQTSL